MASEQSEFLVEEFEGRLARAQKVMTAKGLGGLLLTTHPDIYYFTGFLTRFWESPTRPWYLLVPAKGKPVAVIPSIGAALMCTTWIEDIRTWSSPAPGDDGVSLLGQTIREVIGDAGTGARLGVPDGPETFLRMPLADFRALQALPNMAHLSSDEQIMRDLRLIKSPAEIARIERACHIAGRAFSRMAEIAQIGKPLERVFREFQTVCLEEGADWVPYLAGGAGPEGYADVISPASANPLEAGDILMLDTGLVRDGYFCDYDRNFSLGPPSAPMARAHARLIEATEAAFGLARPGNTASDLYHAMDKVLTDGAGHNDNGRLGHGLGIQLTEWPSLTPSDHTLLQEGMVLTLEPGLATGAGRMIVHEENIVITHDGARFLSPPAMSEISQL